MNLQSFNVENDEIMIETDNEKISEFEMRNDVKIQTCEMSKLFRRHETIVCEFKNTRFLHENEKYAMMMREREINKDKFRCFTINQCISLDFDCFYENNKRHNQMFFIQIFFEQRFFEQEKCRNRNNFFLSSIVSGHRRNKG